MGKILLKHVGNKDKKRYQDDIANIMRIAILTKSHQNSEIEMYSNEELNLLSNSVN